MRVSPASYPRALPWPQLYLFGFLYFLAPMPALFLFFLPIAGAGCFGLPQGPTFTRYLLATRR